MVPASCGLGNVLIKGMALVYNKFLVHSLSVVNAYRQTVLRY